MPTRTFRQKSACRLVFHSSATGEKTIEAHNTGGAAGQRSRDVIECSTDKDIGSPAGSFNATLVPRQEYLELIRVNDWVEIFIDNGTLSGEYSGLAPTKPVMTASIDHIERKRSVGPKGETTELISISGRDYGKVFLKTQLIIDPLVGAFIEQNTFEASVIVNPSADAGNIPLNRPDQVIVELLKRYHDYRSQFLLPDSLISNYQFQSGAASGIRRDIHPVKGRIVVNNHPNVSGNLWSTMEQYAHLLLNELYVDTIDGVPTLVMHERPYSHDAFSELKAVSLFETEIAGETFSKSDMDTKNWFRVYFDSQFIPPEVVDASNRGYVNVKSIERAGLCKLDPTTNAFGKFDSPLVSADSGVDADLIQTFSGLLAEWNYQNDELYSGTVTTRLRQDIHIGNRLDYTNRRTGEKLSFFVERVGHRFTYPGASTSSLTLTRGVPRREDGRFTFPTLKSLQQLVDENVLTLLQNATFDQSAGIAGLATVNANNRAASIGRGAAP